MGEELQESLTRRNSYRSPDRRFFDDESELPPRESDHAIAEFDVVNDRMLAVRDDLMEFIDNSGKRMAVGVANLHYKLGMQYIHAIDEHRLSIVKLTQEVAKLRDQVNRRWYDRPYSWLKKVVARLHHFRILSSNDAGRSKIPK